MKNLWQYQQKQLLVMSEDLNKIRILIDKIDKQIVKSLNDRADLAKKIKKAKASSEEKRYI